MSRVPRAGTAGRPITVRVTDTERAQWGRAASMEGCDTLSSWIVKTLNRRAALKISNGGKGR